LTTNEIYSAFYCDYTELKAFLHSHSYTANPLGCAAANATLDIFEYGKWKMENEKWILEVESEKWKVKSECLSILEFNKKISKYIWDSIQKFKELPNVKEIRQTGMITAIEMIDYPWQERKGLKVYEYGLKNGVLLRPLGNVIYFMPPYIIQKDEVDKMINIAYEGISKIE